MKAPAPMHMDVVAPEVPDTKPSEADQADDRQPTCLERLNRAINGNIEKAFDWLGRFIARRPRLVIVLSIIVFLGLASGISQLENEERGEKLWLPSGTESERDSEIVEDYYPRFGRPETFLLEHPDTENLLTPEAFEFAYGLHRRTIEDVTWDNLSNGEKRIRWEPDQVTFTDVCLNKDATKGADDPLECSMSNILALFSYDAAQWSSQEDILAVINDESAWNRTLVGPGFVLDSYLGGIEYASDGAVVGAKVLSFQYTLAGNDTYEESNDDDPTAREWEKEWIDMLAEAEENSEYNIGRIAAMSFDEEFGATIDNDILLLQVAIVAVAVYTIFAISNCRNGCVGLRIALTIGGLINIGMAVAASYGFGSYIGLIFSPLMTVLPFIMIGIGVDGMFVLQGALDLTDPTSSMEDRMGYTLSHAGVSVTLASLTNFGAFLIGSNTSLPALRAFSIYAAFGILFDFIFQVTFFAAIMCIDQRRQDNRRLDLLCCIKTSSPPNKGIFCGACGEGVPKERFSSKVMRFLGRAYSTIPVKVFVIAAWLGALTLGIVGTAQMEVEADVNDFIPDGSYLNEYFRINEDYLQTTGTSAAVYFMSTEELPLDFSDPAIQEQMDVAIELFKNNEDVVADTFDAWWEGFKAFTGTVDGTIPQDSFYSDLDEFLNTTAGVRYQGDVIFADAANHAAGIQTHRFQFNWRYIEDTIEQIDAMKGTRSTAESIPDPLGTNAFTYGAEFLQIEQYATIGDEALTNIGLGFLMIAVVIIILLANPTASVLTFLCVASAILELVGIMYYMGFRIDSVTVIFLVISLGLAVDYSVHVAHGFLATRESDMRTRLEKTMAETGGSVINGAISTLLAALCLAGSQSYVFVTFFFALLFIVLAGAFQGLAVLPVLLSIFKPAPHVPVLMRNKTPQ